MKWRTVQAAATFVLAVSGLQSWLRSHVKPRCHNYFIGDCFVNGVLETYLGTRISEFGLYATVACMACALIMTAFVWLYCTLRRERQARLRDRGMNANTSITVNVNRSNSFTSSTQATASTVANQFSSNSTTKQVRRA